MSGAPDLSIIIVNYNTKYFLEQCLYSLKKSIAGMNAEILVVDNHSSDASLEYLQPRFPEIFFLANTENTGFAKANNQALKQAQGEYILFLNPDTILSEDCIQGCLSFMRFNPQVGASGVRMLDGRGHFLKESKRGFPDPWVAFFKMFGLAALFPKSEIFAAYYFGHISEFENHEVEVLSGAFFLAQGKIVRDLNGFDERFFMYAEDIDLSYRIREAGYQNYYLADSPIIHFKGESTQRNAQYVRLFYKAMVQFIQKHFHGRSYALFLPFLKAAIWCRAGISRIRMKSAGPRPRKKSNGFFLAGDPEEVERLRKILLAKGMRLLDSIISPCCIIFCEGPLFSFREIIRLIQVDAHAVSIMIHAQNSSSIVGSYSGRSRGEIIVL